MTKIEEPYSISLKTPCPDPEVIFLQDLTITSRRAETNLDEISYLYLFLQQAGKRGPGKKSNYGQ